MELFDAGLALIKDFESLRLVAYQDTGDVWTVGWGHTGRWVREGVTWTQERADTELRVDVWEAEDAVEALVSVPLTQGQYDALVSFVFNCGDTAFGTSTLRRLLNQGDYMGASGQLRRWIFDNGLVVPGLVKRRHLEEALFNS